MNAVRGHKERGWAALFHRGEGLLQLLATPCFDGVECHAQGSRSSLDLVEGKFLVGIRRVPLLECNALSFHVAEIAKAYPEGLPRRRVGGEQPYPWDRRRRLRDGGEWRKNETDRENENEPDPPHGHLGGGWLAGV